MSTADGWDLTVPEDEAELLAELRRHGVRPGQRLHVLPAADQPDRPAKPRTIGPWPDQALELCRVDSR